MQLFSHALSPCSAKVRICARARLLEDDADWMLGTSVNALLEETYRQPDESLRDPARIEAAAEAIRAEHERLERGLRTSRSSCPSRSQPSMGSRRTPSTPPSRPGSRAWRTPLTD